VAVQLGGFRFFRYALHRLTGRITKSSGVFSSKRQNEILLIVISLLNAVLLYDLVFKTICVSEGEFSDFVKMVFTDPSCNTDQGV